MTRRLSDLLANLVDNTQFKDCVITGLALDSRSVKPGDLFFACIGLTVDGRSFIPDAIARGAAAVVYEFTAQEPTLPVAIDSSGTIPLIAARNLPQQLGHIAARFYAHPSQQLTVIGVTGTSGKTSTSQFIAAALQFCGYTCGIIGTLGYGLYGQLQAGIHTTPDALQTQAILADLLAQGAQYVVMEVSSHALVQGRVNGIHFDIAIFTNLSHEHLDYHGDMMAYAKAKRLLFDFPDLRYAVLNADDDYGRRWLAELQGHLTVFGYTLMGNQPTAHGVAMISAEQIYQNNSGVSAYVHTPWGNGQLNTSLLGHFNLSNCLAVLTVLGILGIHFPNALNCIAQLRAVPGRMEVLGGNELPVVIIDYAHKPEPLKQVLQTLRAHCQGKLWCVFGCGGNRDRAKRPIMGQIAEQYADQVIVTSDNPRHEDPLAIIQEITQGMSSTKWQCEPDRRKAIQYAVLQAKAGDIVLIAGKGHENYQQVGDKKNPFSDIAEVKLLLNIPVG